MACETQTIYSPALYKKECADVWLRQRRHISECEFPFAWFFFSSALHIGMPGVVAVMVSRPEELWNKVPRFVIPRLLKYQYQPLESSLGHLGAESGFRFRVLKFLVCPTSSSSPCLCPTFHFVQIGAFFWKAQLWPTTHGPTVSAKADQRKPKTKCLRTRGKTNKWRDNLYQRTLESGPEAAKEGRERPENTNIGQKCVQEQLDLTLSLGSSWDLNVMRSSPGMGSMLLSVEPA